MRRMLLADIWPEAPQAIEEIKQMLALRRNEVAAVRARRDHLRLVATMEPADWQEAHSRTVPVEVTLATVVERHGQRVVRRTKEQSRRRKPDARVWDAMTADQEWAADMVMDGWRITGGEIGCRTMAFERQNPAYEPEWWPQFILDAESQCAITFGNWVREGRKLGIHAMSVIDYLAGGFTLDEIDTKRRVRKGETREMIFRALDFMIETAKRTAQAGPTMDDTWRIRAQAWLDFGVWVRAYGPKPDEVGTKVPATVRAALGIKR